MHAPRVRVDAGTVRPGGTRRGPLPVDRRGAVLATLVLILLTAGGIPGMPGRAASPLPVPGTEAGPWAVGMRDAVVPAEGRSFGTWLLYPAVGPGGADAPLVAGRFPVVVFGHGYLASVELYASTLRHLASWGFIVAAPRSGGELFPSHATFAADFSAVLTWLGIEATRGRSWLHEAVLPGAFAASGHSMGGGASMLAAASDRRFAAVVNLAAAETDPSAVEAAADISVPVLLVAAELDGITPVAAHQRPMFEALVHAPAQLRTIRGGSHCGFLDPQAGLIATGLLELVCDEGTIDRSTQLALGAGLMADWLRYHLLDAVELEPSVWPGGDDATTLVESSRP